MAVTYFVALPIVHDDAGGHAALDGVECPSPDGAKLRAQSLAALHGGAVAFSRTGEPRTGEFEDAVILGRYGDLPTDLADFTRG